MEKMKRYEDFKSEDNKTDYLTIEIIHISI